MEERGAANDQVHALTPQDQETLRQRGINPKEIARQWTQLVEPGQPIALDRPCTIDDGIRRIGTSDSERRQLMEAHQQAASGGRWLKFVPASGAASRMFAFRSEDDKQKFCTFLNRFPFAEKLHTYFRGVAGETAELSDSQRYDEIVDALTRPDALGYGEAPKGLVEFHRYEDGTRTAFEEHLAESIRGFRDSEGNASSHFTIALEHQPRFSACLDEFRAKVTDATCRVGFSIQDPSTDTIAVDHDGNLLHDARGELILRPGGHGALIENLNRLQADLIFVKNIDNVGHQESQQHSAIWMQVLGGYLVQLLESSHAHLRAVRTGDGDGLAAARDFVGRTFPAACCDDATPEQFVAVLRRPLRVCGMVKNEGEPGGGPFWAQEPDGSQSLQIVESAEVPSDDPRQQEIFRQSTHFNPVFMALAVRDELGQAFDLREFVADNRVIITEKRVGGRDATVLERPGLWNGAMAKWNTVFAEVPKEVFTPVKNVLDLLRAEHQPGA